MSEHTDKSYIRKSHRVFFAILRFLSFLYTRIILGYRCRDRYRIEKGESVLVLSNHQTDADPFCIMPCFSNPVYPIATDNIFAGKLRSKLFSYLGVIPKKKGAVDVRSVLRMFDLLKKGGSVLLFPEGNRYYAEFQYYIAPSLGRMIKKTGATIVIFNVHGGSGKSPRFKNRNRRGKFFGEIRRIIKPDEYTGMSDSELFEAIRDGIRVFDSESTERYRSGRRAEYLERMFFVCPVCGEFENLVSRGKLVRCRRCGATAEYGEDLRLHGKTPGFDFTRLVEWWDYQKHAVCDKKIIPGNVIFGGDRAKLFCSVPFENRKLITRGTVSITDSVIKCGNKAFDLSSVESASVISGRNLTFVHNGKDYTIRGGKRFNPLKYIYMFNLLDTRMRRESGDKYFNPEE